MKRWFCTLIFAALHTGSSGLTAADQAVVYSTDFSVAYYSSLALASPHTTNVDIDNTCSDAVFRSQDGKIYALGRFGCDFVQVIDPAQSFQSIAQWSTGNGTNPHDIEVKSDTKAYISLYDTDYILIMNLETGQHLGQIDLSQFSDDDGLPEPDGMLLHDNKLFVALQRVDRNDNFQPNNDSFVAVIDCDSDEIIDVDTTTEGVQAITLTGRNPFTDLHWDPVRQKIYVGEVGFFGSQDGGVEWINPLSLQAEGFFITESTLGGDLNAVVNYVDCTGYAITNDTSFNTKVVRYNLCEGTAEEDCRTASGFFYSDLEIDTLGGLWFTDRDFTAPGVRRIATPGCSETAGPIDFGLPPQDIVLVSNCDPTVTDTQGLPPSMASLRNFPDPFNPRTSIRFSLQQDAHVRVSIYDARGRMQRLLWNGDATSGEVRFDWDGRDRHGRPLSSGVYYVELRTGDGRLREKMTLIR